MPQAVKIKPGILVALTTSIKGVVEYETLDLGSQCDGSVQVDQWQTKKTVADVAEHKAATEIRSRARSLIGSACYHTAFGFVALEANEKELDANIAAAQKNIEEFNAKATYAKVSLAVLKGRIASTDQEAVRSIREETARLLEIMERAVKIGDVTAIRDAANKARQVGQMLDGAAAEKASEAINGARAIARTIVKEIGERGVTAESVIAEIGYEKVATARMAFLDLDISADATAIEPIETLNAERFADAL